MHHSPRFLLALLSSLGLSAACSSGSVGSGCRTDVDCGRGLYCAQGGSCLAAKSVICATNSECTNGQVCIAGVCLASSSGGTTSTGLSGTTSGSASGSASSTSGSNGAGYYCATCAHDADCNPAGWAGYSINSIAGNSCQYDPSGTYTWCGLDCSAGQACPNGSVCLPTYNELTNGIYQILQCMPTGCATTGSSTSSSGTVTSATTTTATTTTTTTASSSTTAASSSSTSGCTTWHSTDANNFYSNNCNYCHGHAWVYSDGCTYSSIPSRIQSGNMPPGGGLSSSDQTNILQYITCGCPQ